jgi:outer membrane lipoprotein-sorting protein
VTFASLLVAGALAAGLVVDPEAESLANRMDAAWARVDTLTYRFNKTERMRDGAVIVEEVAVKLKKPLLLYIAALLPQPGQEIIYDPRTDRERFAVHPGSFPDITLHLAIDGSLATRGQHHLLTHAGLGYTIGTLKAGIARARKEEEGGVLHYVGSTTLWGRKAHMIRFEAGDLTSLEIMAREDETLFAFATRVGMDAYAIFCVNPELDAVTDELEPRPYKVPKNYGAKTEFTIDAETYLPIRVTIWDKLGHVYERYDYMDMVVDPKLTDLDFDPKNPAYDF